jgi:hypothetical protein
VAHGGKYSEHRRVINPLRRRVSLPIAGPFAHPPKPVRETSGRNGLPLILMLRFVVLVLKVLEPIHVIAQHGPVALR